MKQARQDGDDVTVRFGGMRGKDRLTAMMVGSILLATGACAGRDGVAVRGPVLESSARPPVTDIPVPAGFRLVEKSCEDWASGSIRYVRHRYVGRADKAAVRRFYREQMVLVRWAAVNEGSVKGSVTMRFERGAEECTVRLESAAGGRPDQVVVDVIINPSHREPHEIETRKAKVAK